MKPTREERANMSKAEMLRSLWLLDDYIGLLEKQLNNGWIPCSERLPEVCGLGVLLTIENKFQQRKVIQGFTGYMEMGKLEFHTNDKCTNLEVWNVIAWQSLPESWKEESE